MRPRSALSFLGLALALISFAVLHATTAAAQSGGRTFTVTSPVDASDMSIGDGHCRSFGTGSPCTLRAAIEESNALPGIDTINIEAGVYELEIPTVNEDSDSSGDFDIRDSVVIDGAGATGLGATIVDGGFPPEGSPIEQRGMDRLFEIHPTALNVTFRELTIREGFSDDAGAGIQNWSPGRVRVEDARFIDNLASSSGGGINQAEPSEYTCPLCLPLLMPGGRLEIVRTTLSGNAAGSGGAAVNNAGSGTVLIEDSDVSDNPGKMIPDPLFVDDPLDPFDRPDLIPAPGVYEPSQPAIDNQASFDVVGTVHIVRSKVEDNYATHDGAGVSNSGHGILTIEDSEFRRNSTEGDGGAIYSTGGTLTIDDTIVASNKAHGGGGIYSDGASNAIGLRSRVTITDTQVSGNDALPFPEPLPPDPANIAEASGGGMVLDGEAQMTLSDVNVSGNFAGDGGGGFAAEGLVSLVATRLTVTNNKAHGEGGGIYSDTGRPVVIRDSLVKGNYGGYPEPRGPGDLPPLGTPGGPVFESHSNVAGGGGIYTEGGPVEIQGTTVEDNTATEEGGGISIDNFDKVLLADSTLRGNKAGAGRRRRREQRHAHDVRSPDRRGQQGDHRRRRHLQLVERRVPRHRLDDAAQHRARRRRLRQRPRRGSDHPPVDDHGQRRPHAGARRRRAAARRRRGRRLLEQGGRQRADREHHDLEQQGGDRRRRRVPRRRRRAQVLQRHDLAQHRLPGRRHRHRGVGLRAGGPAEGERVGHPAQHGRRRQPLRWQLRLVRHLRGRQHLRRQRPVRVQAGPGHDRRPDPGDQRLLRPPAAGHERLADRRAARPLRQPPPRRARRQRRARRSRTRSGARASPSTTRSCPARRPTSAASCARRT